MSLARLAPTLAVTLLASAALVAPAAGCKKKDDAGAGAATGTGTGSAAGSGGEAAAALDAGAAPPCELAGDYRLRFRSNGQDGWWLRFKVSGAGADARGEVTAPAPMLRLDPALLVTLDPAACKLEVKGSGKAGGDVALALAVDAATGAVTGQLTRTQAVSDDDRAVAVTGVRDLGAPRPPEPCFVAGLYKLDVDSDAKATWKNADPGDDRSCEEVMTLPVMVRVEPVADTIVISPVDGEPPHEDTFGTVTATRSGCDVALTVGTELLQLEGKVTFAADKVRGTATVKHQMIEDGDEGEGLWDCTAQGVTVTLVRQ